MHVYFDDSGHFVRAEPLGEQDEAYVATIRKPSYVPRRRCSGFVGNDMSGYGAEEESLFEEGDEMAEEEEGFMGADAEWEDGAEDEEVPLAGPFEEPGPIASARRRSSVGNRHLFFDTSESSIGDTSGAQDESGASMSRHSRLSSASAGSRGSATAESTDADHTAQSAASALNETEEDGEEEEEGSIGIRAAAAIQAALAAEKRAGLGGPRRVSPGEMIEDEVEDDVECEAEYDEEDGMADEQEEDEEEIAIDVMTRITERTVETDDEDTLGVGAASAVGTPARALMQSARRKSVRTGGQKRRRSSVAGAAAASPAGVRDGAPSAKKARTLSSSGGGSGSRPAGGDGADAGVEQDHWSVAELQGWTYAALRKTCKELGLRAAGKKVDLVGRLLEFQAEAIDAMEGDEAEEEQE